MRRWSLIGILLMLAAASLFFTIWDYSRVQVWTLGVTHQFFLEAGMMHGSLVAGYATRPVPQPGHIEYYTIAIPPNTPMPGRFLGFMLYRDPSEKGVGVPLLLITAVSLFVAWRIYRRRVYLPGTCPSCGYDLRATPDGAELLAVCPECGISSDVQKV